MWAKRHILPPIGCFPNGHESFEHHDKFITSFLPFSQTPMSHIIWRDSVEVWFWVHLKPQMNHATVDVLLEVKSENHLSKIQTATTVILNPSCRPGRTRGHFAGVPMSTKRCSRVQHSHLFSFSFPRTACNPSKSSPPSPSTLVLPAYTRSLSTHHVSSCLIVSITSQALHSKPNPDK